MKLEKLLELYPQKTNLKQVLKTKKKTLATLEKEVDILEKQLAELDGIALHEGFPIKYLNLNQTDAEVIAGSSDIRRYAFIQQVTGTNDYRVVGFKSDADSDGKELSPGTSARKATKIAKDWVAFGPVKKVESV